MNDKELQQVEKIKQTSIYNTVRNWITSLKTRTILDIIIIATPILIVYIFFYVRPNEIKETQTQNQIIEKKVDTLKDANAFIVSRMYELEKRQEEFYNALNTNNNLILENNKELAKLNKIYNEKLKNVSRYNASQLDSFFSANYSQYYKK